MEFILIFGLMFVTICLETTILMYLWVKNQELKAATKNLKLSF